MFSPRSKVGEGAKECGVRGERTDRGEESAVFGVIRRAATAGRRPDCCIDQAARGTYKLYRSLFQRSYV